MFDRVLNMSLQNWLSENAETKTVYIITKVLNYYLEGIGGFSKFVTTLQGTPQKFKLIIQVD